MYRALEILLNTASAVSAAATGFFFGAVYLRCRNLRAMAALHAFNDFAVMFDKGVFAGGTIRSAIDSHSVKVLIGAVLYVAIGIYLLRGEKMNYTDSGNDTLRQHRTMIVR